MSSERIEREFQAKKKRDGEPLEEKPTGKRQKQIATKQSKSKSPQTENLEKTDADAEYVQALRMLTKRCRRRLQELLAYKLSHRSVIPGQAMYDFEDWVSSKLHPFTFDKLVAIPENKERIKLLIKYMKAAILASLNLGKLDEKFKPDGVVSELDESDDEWETDEASAGSKQGEQRQSGAAKPDVEAKLDAIMSMLSEGKIDSNSIKSMLSEGKLDSNSIKSMLSEVKTSVDKIAKPVVKLRLLQED